MTIKDKRKLDKWIAEHVMGWRWFRFKMLRKDTAENASVGYNRWQQLVPPNETWHLNPKYNAVEQLQGEVRYLEDETDLSLFKPTEDAACATAVLKKCSQKIVHGTEFVCIAWSNPQCSTLSKKGHWNVGRLDKGFWVDGCANDAILELAICKWAKSLFMKEEKWKK